MVFGYLACLLNNGGHMYYADVYLMGSNTSTKWETSDQNLHINDHFWFGDRWWLIFGPLLRDQKWSHLIWLFIAYLLVIYSVINLVVYLVINCTQLMTKYTTKYMTKLMTKRQAINNQIKYDHFWSCNKG